mmetsp:Transcript_21224/g.49835  ORF Transcript_21224/g.49835 Transcript_21224/m.49835 type:complete len:253 (+) Transcript_21224:836-1594(+)
MHNVAHIHSRVVKREAHGVCRHVQVAWHARDTNKASDGTAGPASCLPITGFSPRTNCAELKVIRGQHGVDVLHQCFRCPVAVVGVVFVAHACDSGVRATAIHTDGRECVDVLRMAESMGILSSTVHLSHGDNFRGVFLSNEPGCVFPHRPQLPAPRTPRGIKIDQHQLGPSHGGIPSAWGQLHGDLFVGCLNSPVFWSLGLRNLGNSLHVLVNLPFMDSLSNVNFVAAKHVRDVHARKLALQMRECDIKVDL